jgi:hypothetical protein
MDATANALVRAGFFWFSLHLRYDYFAGQNFRDLLIGYCREAACSLFPALLDYKKWPGG